MPVVNDKGIYYLVSIWGNLDLEYDFLVKGEEQTEHAHSHILDQIPSNCPNNSHKMEIRRKRRAEKSCAE